MIRDHYRGIKNFFSGPNFNLIGNISIRFLPMQSSVVKSSQPVHQKNIFSNRGGILKAGKTIVD